MTRLAGAIAGVGLGVVVVSGAGWTPQASGTSARLRGVSAVSDRVAWASGNRGTVVRTVDGGRSWAPVGPTDAAALDFRDIEAFDADTAYVLSIGSGDASRIYKTTDGGRHWDLQFRNADPKAFYDAIAFWDAAHGLAFGDPVDGHFTVVRTEDGGRTWVPVPPANLPPALEGEGAFAASGTCLVTVGRDHAWFGTGGAARARVFRSADRGRTWAAADTPVMAGNASSGIFSLAFADAQHGLAVGGDYRKEREGGDNVARTEDGGRTWTLTDRTRLRSFRSAVAFVPGARGRTVIAVGPGGTDISTDVGATWTPLGEEGYHAFSMARSGRSGWAAGEQGRVARFN